MAYRMRTQRLALTQWVAANASVDAATNCSQSVEVYLMGGTVPHEQANLAHTARGDTLLAAFGDEMRRHIDRWRPEPEEYEAEAPPVIHFASYADTLEATSATPTNPTPAKKYTGADADQNRRHQEGIDRGRVHRGRLARGEQRAQQAQLVGLPDQRVGLPASHHSARPARRPKLIRRRRLITTDDGPAIVCSSHHIIIQFTYYRHTACSGRRHHPGAGRRRRHADRAAVRRRCSELRRLRRGRRRCLFRSTPPR